MDTEVVDFAPLQSNTPDVAYVKNHFLRHPRLLCHKPTYEAKMLAGHKKVVMWVHSYANFLTISNNDGRVLGLMYVHWHSVRWNQQLKVGITGHFFSFYLILGFILVSLLVLRHRKRCCHKALSSSYRYLRSNRIPFYLKIIIIETKYNDPINTLSHISKHNST